MVLALLVLACAVALRPDRATTDRWLRVLGIVAVGVATYGWFQFLFAPPWDTMWMRSSGMMSIGRPEPMQIRVFATLAA
ncbi:MAG: hypothetical protein ACOCYN_03940, partial [Planctomycetota bacterium]